LGLSHVTADAWFPLDDERSQAIERLTVALLGDTLIDAGLVTPSEIDAHLANLDEGLVHVVQPPLVACWGSKASDQHRWGLRSPTEG
jgi:hypothetical protein